MRETRPRLGRLGTMVLVLICCGLSVVIYRTIAQPSVPLAAAASAASHTPPPRDKGRRLSMPPLGVFAEVVMRPLFSETRRPAAQGQAALSDKPPDIALVGIVISLKERRALLSHGTPAHLEHVVEGETVDGWTVTAIEPNRVLLAQGGREAEISTATKPREIAKAEPPHYAIGTEPTLNGGD